MELDIRILDGKAVSVAPVDVVKRQAEVRLQLLRARERVRELEALLAKLVESEVKLGKA